MNKIIIPKVITALLLVFLFAQTLQSQPLRQRINLDKDWFFAYGHPYDKASDFNTGTGYFSYLAKAGYGDGAAARHFDHRAWRKLDVPHDWAVEVPFDAKGSHSHGYKAVGPGFPESSVGWYRKTFTLDATQKGQQVFIDFDGVSRDAKVWVNGFYLGNEPSGYQSFSYNITDLVDFGAANTIAVRADVSFEEGWYYEGAGIYRHVWLRVTPNVHVPQNGVFVHSVVHPDKATLFVETELENRGFLPAQAHIVHQLINHEGMVVAASEATPLAVSAMAKGGITSSFDLTQPRLWGLADPYLYTLRTQVLVDGNVVDEMDTRTGIRSIRFDANKGFFLNDEHVKLKGTNNHQDHAGVGCAMPDELIRWRLMQLKAFGSNAIRSSHNPPTPELLSLCDELGILVIDENRLMGTTAEALTELERLMKRDRNHPCVIVWSVGNEEWGIEGNEKGANITRNMQNFAKTIDPTRPVNVASSGGWGYGSSTTVEVMGFNYLVHGDTDAHHKAFPHQPGIGTEEGSTFATRGVYVEDDQKQYKTAYDNRPREPWYTIQEGWKYYAERDYLAGMFIWTGFDYRGESTPYQWPSVTSYFGMMDLCGFPKDNVFYLKSWWQNEPTLHVLPHWNWQGREDEPIDVWVYSNCQQVELFLNDRSLGLKDMPKNGHLSWQVPYQAGRLLAKGYNNKQEVLQAQRVTTGVPAQLQLEAHQQTIKGDGTDVSVITVQVLDADGHAVPDADQLITFELTGPGKIIGVGNGNPTSHENERFIETFHQLPSTDGTIIAASHAEVQKALADWPAKTRKAFLKDTTMAGLIATFDLTEGPVNNTAYTWYYKHVAPTQSIWLNGHLLTPTPIADTADAAFVLKPEWLKKGQNNILVLGAPYAPKNAWDTPNRNTGTIQSVTAAQPWQRQLFNGLAQVIVQSAPDNGTIVLKATAQGVNGAQIDINVKK